MKTVLIFAGTTEGRELVEALVRSHVSCHACVATEYGSQLLKSNDYVTVHSGRLDEMGMRALYETISCDIVVDATHPYAQIVTETIKKSIEGTGISYLRLLRGNDVLAQGILSYDSIKDCVEGLKKTTGNILLTTGSKQLAEFTQDENLRKRLFARVLPGLESLELCYHAGLEGRQIIAMQGPFSSEMNEITIREYGIEHLVTKESGAAGGVDSKLEAAQRTGITVHVLKRPMEEEKSGKKNQGLSFAETVSSLEKLLEVSLSRGLLRIVLAGIGPGSGEMMTQEVKEAVLHADYLFGAQRMLDAIDSSAKKYPYYLKKDIVPFLEELSEKTYRDLNMVVLFSGDSGFYSGCKKLYEALKDKEQYDVKIMPGISSVATLAARLGIDWQDGRIISLHGIPKEEWIPMLREEVQTEEKIFLITSGVQDVQKIGQVLSDLEDKTKLTLHFGFQLSYPEEKILEPTCKECEDITEEGLYCGVIQNPFRKRRNLVPVLSDDWFERDKVPMTKEEIRKLSICQMRLKEGDVIYDIGSGTGSVSVQIASLSSSLRVFALECDPQATVLTRKNIEKATLSNVVVVETMAPDGLDALPKADACFIGGSRGNLGKILETLRAINPAMRVVMNAVSMDSICEMYGLLKSFVVRDLSITQISVTKTKEIGQYQMLNANNPVFLFAFTFGE